MFEKNFIPAGHGLTDAADTDHASEVERIDERRGSQRHRAVMRAARLSSCVHRVETMGLVRNISESGMLVESPVSFANGEKVAISLMDGDRIEGEIVWQRDNSFGIRFGRWISVDSALARTQSGKGSKPRAPRLTLQLPVLVRTGSLLADGQICDISQRGAKIRFNQYLPIDCRVQISHGNLRPITGSVKWQVGNLIGLEFYRTLGVDELAGWTQNKMA
ncbi:MAG: PilZ domain-containing protein [Sphingomonadaceae bacterium]|nr:PilZ domain-containing protein [Sphingomonadaceae bacterium]